MFGLGTPELLVILAIAALLFGGKKLPEIGSALGKTLGSFKKGLGDIEETSADLKKNIPGVRQITEVKEKVDTVRDITRLINK